MYCDAVPKSSQTMLWLAYEAGRFANRQCLTAHDGICEKHHSGGDPAYLKIAFRMKNNITTQGSDSPEDNKFEKPWDGHDMGPKC